MTEPRRPGDLLGIDLGTSSCKVLVRHADGSIEKGKATYTEESPDAWWEAVKAALRTVDCRAVTAVGLSAQTGTYVVNGKDVIGWRCTEGRETLDRVRSSYTEETFLSEIAMPQPPLVSYPIPRLLYIKERYGTVTSVCQPKDEIVRRLTGNLVSDYYTWRGLADPKTARYSAFFLGELGIDPEVLPPLLSPTSLAGRIHRDVSLETGIPENTEVYLGMNDFYASIVGMGIIDGGTFDITGTSEHLGVIEDTIAHGTPLVSSPYFDRFVQYGVTASGGASLDLVARELGDLPASSDDPAYFLERKPPIYLPYLRGERAPIFDGEATGAFFGMTAGTTREDMAYAVCEGVAFSLYHIYETMGCKNSGDRVTVSGGASRLPLLSRVKAELFGKRFVALAENDTSALGAVMAAGVGGGAFGSYAAAAEECVKDGECFEPSGGLREALMRRYEIYKRLYPILKDEMHAFRREI